MNTTRRQCQQDRNGTRRTGSRRVAGFDRLRPLAAPAALSAAALRHAARLALIWFTAFALIFQTTLALAAPVAGAEQPDALALSALCDSGFAHPPADSGDHGVAPHIKCIGCVIGHSLAPPVPLPAIGPLPNFVDAAPTWRLSAAVPRAAPAAAHSARGPPAAI
ncbi:hypothetical protein [Rhodopseudomonas palustris]|uniref:hypothetical protein n=1 Tax=Rhodopseudomonas palustris TaxID=1076 RepID=UPI0002F25DFF